MAEPLQHKDRTEPVEPAGTDREIPTGKVLGFVAGIGALLMFVAGLMWLLSVHLRRERVALDPSPSPLPEANEIRPPPLPRLQPTPNVDIMALRAREDALLKSYGWVDRDAGVGRIPIDRAIELSLAGAPFPMGPAPETAQSPVVGDAGAPPNEAAATDAGSADAGSADAGANDAGSAGTGSADASTDDAGAAKGKKRRKPERGAP